MDEAINCKGYWWKPSDPEVKIPGVVTCSAEGGISLRLFGAFGHDPDFRTPLLLGIGIDGRKMTLGDCYSSGVSRSMNIDSGVTAVSSEYRAHLLIDGGHVDSSEMLLQGVTVVFPFTESWSDLSAIRPVFGSVIADDRPPVKYDVPEPFVALVDDLEISFRLEVVEAFGMGKETPTFSIASRKEPRPWIDFHKYIRTLQTFVTLALGVAVKPSSIFGRIRTGSHRDRLRIVSMEFGVLSVREEFHRSRMSFTLGDIQHAFADVLTQWFKRADRLRGVYDIYFVAVAEDMIVENKLMNLTQALESYHRNVYGGAYYSDVRYSV